MKNFIRVVKPIHNYKRKYHLYPGAYINLDEAVKSMIKLLRFEYEKDPEVIEGDLEKLYTIDAEYFSASERNHKCQK